MRHENQTLTGAPFRLSWPALFGGFVTASAVWLMLYTLGLAVGFSSFSVDQPNLIKAIGIGGGIWLVLSSFLAMFAGGVVTARSAGYLGRGNGAIHGVVLWGSTALAGTLLLGSAMGAFAAQAAQAGGEMASMAMGSADLNVEAALVPLNAKLEASGKPAVTSEQLKAIAKDAAATAATRGTFDKNAFISAVAEGTALDRAEVQEVFAGTMQQVERRIAAVRDRAEAAAQSAAVATGRALWAIFGLLVTALVGSVLGASMGMARAQRDPIRAPSSATVLDADRVGHVS